MNSRPFPPACVALVVNGLAIHASRASSTRTGLQAGAATPADERRSAFPAMLLPGEKVRRFHLSRYGSGVGMTSILLPTSCSKVNGLRSPNLTAVNDSGRTFSENRSHAASGLINLSMRVPSDLKQVD
jgi:hypothetical protein